MSASAPRPAVPAAVACVEFLEYRSVYHGALSAASFVVDARSRLVLADVFARVFRAHSLAEQTFAADVDAAWRIADGAGVGPLDRGELDRGDGTRASDASLASLRTALESMAV